MKNIGFYFIILTALLISCKDDKLPATNIPSGENVQDSDTICIQFGTDSIKFVPIDCPNGNDLTSNFISAYIGKDSFAINRRTTISTGYFTPCDEKQIQIGIEIKDKIENYPVAEQHMRTYLNQIKQKNALASRFQVQFSKSCDTYQNYERIFKNNNPIYQFSKNDQFDYNIESYNIVNACEKDPGHFIVELKGNFKGFLYTTPNISKKDSIFVECRNFKVKILHNPNN
ncbi:MAG: hypothetical protein NW218_03695 [Saprospiraceae bacterium]|nr:hypothetical protein [Saprospiraceae bacterium]